MTQLPPPHVLEAFGAYGNPEPAGPAWDDGYQYGNIVVSRVADSQRAAWSAKVREVLAADGVSVARPVRTTDGRHVLGGWQARHFAPGAPALRADELIVASSRLEDALSGLARPRFLARSPEDVFGVCDRAAWVNDPAAELEKVLDVSTVPSADAADALAAAAELTRLRRDFDAEEHICHADPLATTIFDGANVPVVTDLVPCWHPAGYTPALAAVDALIFGGADEGLLRRFTHIPHWHQQVLRAMLYRLFIHAVHPDAALTNWRGLSRAAELVKAACAEQVRAEGDAN
ncbi:TIGR02569 family protein [Corynebacterium sp. TAE3-ERU12]|uniref:TIGR02569 family protein n=1 Tax=Corynebacterium sp. TAE3-ERU12 TaxID=2849491 RepID=UPI001C48A438|nr:TIGR02569 family protein [Corynebacterium sp. TAE3-ERU12]MBV7294841.1 TIGR02569 family protein [Corynebacterium sp. TAE3-ERU12]